MQGDCPFGRWALSRNAPQLGVWICPETPQRIWAGIIVACGIRGVSGRRAPWRPGCNCKKRTPFHTPYKARRCCSYPPDRRGRRLCWYPHFHGRYTQKPIGKDTWAETLADLMIKLREIERNAVKLQREQLLANIRQVQESGTERRK